MSNSHDIKKEIKQSKPFEYKSAEAIVALLRTTDEIKRRISEVTAREDITPQQYNVLRILRGAGDEGLPTLEVGKRMIERSPGITRLIDRMEKKGLVTRNRSGSDRRCVPCKITSRGIEVLDSLRDPMARIEADIDQKISSDNLDQLIELLADLRK